ncbi:MAG TPA: hypothetical protein VGG62_06435 [Terracidiphilus sp.]|jgi:hypothetical protein
MTDNVPIPPLTLKLDDNNFTEDQLRAAVNVAIDQNNQFVTALRRAHKNSKTAELTTHKQFPGGGH